MLTGQTRSEACFVRKMAERPGKKSCFMTKTPARSIWRSNRGIRRRFLPLYGRREGHRGVFTLLRTDRAAASIAQMTEATIGNTLADRDCRQKILGGSASVLRRAIRGGFI